MQQPPRRGAGLFFPPFVGGGPNMGHVIPGPVAGRFEAGLKAVWREDSTSLLVGRRGLHAKVVARLVPVCDSPWWNSRDM